MKHPIQPVYRDVQGQLRFKANAIIQYMLDAGRRGVTFDLNTLAGMGFDAEDHEQLAQLIGYSVSGFSELSYVSDETYQRVEDEVQRCVENTERK